MTDGPQPGSSFDGDPERLMGRLKEAEAALHQEALSRSDAGSDSLSSIRLVLQEAQRALQHWETRCRCLMASLPAIVCELEPDGTTVYVNDAVLNISGYRPEELVGKNWWDIFYPGEARQQVDALYQRLKSGPVTGYEMTLTAKDGSPRHLTWDSADPCACGKATTNLLGIGLDITERKQAEERLSQLAAIVESSNDAIISADLRGKILSWNSGAERLYGYAADEVIGESFAILLPLGWMTKMSDSLARLRRGEHVERPETLRMSKNGDILYVFTTISPVKDSAGKIVGFSGIARDITDRKQAVEALRASEERFRLLASNAQDFIYRLHLKPDLKFEYVSPAATTFGGYAPEAYYAGASLLLRMVHPGDSPRLQRYLADPDNSDPIFEMRWIRKDGEVIWTEQRHAFIYDDDGSVVAVEGIARDVTQRKAIEDVLRQRERELRALLDSLPAYVVFKDISGRYITANKKWCDEVGYPLNELPGKTQHDVFPKDLADKYRADDLRMIAAGELLFVGEEEQTKGDGRILVETYKVPLKDEQGNVTGLIGLSLDVTERKQMEEQLLRAQRLETAGKIAGQVAHDFNNLLAPLAGYPELIKRELPNRHPAVHYCDLMLEAAKQMADINQDLMTLARRGHFNQELLNLNQLARRAVEHLQNRPYSLTVELDLFEGLSPVMGSSAQLMRVISNLLTNAREATQDAGRIVMKTRNLRRSAPTGSHIRSETGDYVRLDVSDSGCGIPTEVRQKVFDAFFTTKVRGKRRGSGLGLSIVQTIVQDHHGCVELESEEGKGTTFSVYLPVSCERPELQQAPGRPGGSESILIVDDDAVQREVVGRLLESLGYGVSRVESGESAVAFLKERSVDLLILDMIMPGGIDGAETYRRVTEIKPGQRAILLSGFAASERVQEAQNLGAGAYIRKPVTLEVLAQAVRNELNRGK